MTPDQKNIVGVATLEILRHMGFSVRLATADQPIVTYNHVWTAAHAPLNFAHDLDYSISAGDTTVSRNVPVSDLWDDVDTVLASALSAKIFLTEPPFTV
jgi:hypothetical protein